MATLVNCTPHPIRIVLPSGRTLELPAAAHPARLIAPPARSTALAVNAETVEVLVEAPPHETEDLPAPRPGTYYLVSSLLAAAHAGRPDLLAPATGPDDGALRDDAGRICAVTRLRRYVGIPIHQPAAPHLHRWRRRVTRWLLALRRNSAHAPGSPAGT